MSSRGHSQRDMRNGSIHNTQNSSYRQTNGNARTNLDQIVPALAKPERERVYMQQARFDYPDDAPVTKP